MRHWRASLVIVLATGLFAGVPTWASGASAGGGVQVTINGQPGPRLSGGTLSGNEGPRQSATIRDSSGGRSTVSVGGTPASTLVELIGINPSSVQQLVVLGPSGSESVALDTDDIVEGFAGDPKGTRFATFDASSGNGVSFFRPLRDDADINNRDRLNAPISKDLEVQLFTDAPALNVTSSADRMKPSAGTDVRFEASSDGNRRHYFFWDFGDGTDGFGRSTAHVFAAAGTYDVTVTVTSPNGSSGVAVPLRIQVGTAKTGGTATTPRATAPAGGGSGGSGTGGGQESSGGGSGGPGAPTSGPAKGEEGTGGSSASRARRRAREKAAAGRRAERAKSAFKSKAPAPAPDNADRQPGSTVRGKLVADSSAVSSEALAAAEALARLPDRSRTAARAAAGSDSSLLGRAVGGALLLGLLMTGAMREGLRPSRRLLLPS